MLDPQNNSQDEIAKLEIDRQAMMSKLCASDAGIEILRWLVRITGFNRPTMNMEDAVRRDMWLRIRRYVPVEKLSEIEHHDLRSEQIRRDMLLAELLEEKGEYPDAPS